MEGEANLPAPPISDKILKSTITDCSSTSSTSSSSFSPPDFLRHVQAAFKRHRAVGTMASNVSRARRILVHHQEHADSVSKNPLLSSNIGPKVQHDDKTKGPIQEESFPVQEESLVTPPSISLPNKTNGGVSSSCIQTTSQSVSVKHSKGVDELTVTTGRPDNLSSHMTYLALTERETGRNNRVATSRGNDPDPKKKDFQTMDMYDIGTGTGKTHLSENRSGHIHDQHFVDFLHKDAIHPNTQQSSIIQSYATTTSVHSTSAPKLNSTTYCSQSSQNHNLHKKLEYLEMSSKNSQVKDQEIPAYQKVSLASTGDDNAPKQGFSSIKEVALDIQSSDLLKGQYPGVEEDNSHLNDGKALKIDEKRSKKHSHSSVMSEQSNVLPPKSVNLDTHQSSKNEKTNARESRKRNYDPDLFFKVNGKRYQKLGKIGSGGSSEVYKVITSDCSIYALKKIKLKGRDYSTAYGFCQEIGYLNKLKGKDNIIQLIDYEVTDKMLLQEVLDGSMSNKEGRIKDDGYIYMVLEYGEIDLAHMLSHKWREMDNTTNWIMDENWLRFYWQQILQAVNTIHEERIVHSDLKPANFLLVKGSLKLIDFGIAKAILSDTTNIQRDAQVGTLNYMSPEAFMWNEHDVSGNTIKCGRPSDIWSLGCILYQMVYGRTPFAEYKTFWAKFKVITDRHHKISYDPVSNPWLIDLMKKCLAWERHERWRIPQLLHHPFLVPPIPSSPNPTKDTHQNMLMEIAEAHRNNAEVYSLCAQLQKILENFEREE